MARRGRTSPGSTRGEAPGPATTFAGGRWKPLDTAGVSRIAEAAITVLTEIGLTDATEVVARPILARGGTMCGNRLRFSRDLVEDTIANAPKRVLLAGQSPAHDLRVGGTSVFAGTGGAAPNVIDHDTGDHRPSTRADLHDAARLADALPQVRFFARSLVAGDITDPERLDLATAAACLTGTSKHVIVAASDPAHVAPIASMCLQIAGGEAAFRARPFLSLNINHVVPPLRFHAASMEVMAEAVRHGIPVHCNVFGQLGASSPVTLAGSVAQTLAEVLAGLAFVHALNPDAPRIAGPRPMITDLRTGGMAGGAGEQAMATGIAVQVLRHWDLPCSVIAGATDSKLADFQAGYEKALSISTAAQAGANLITQAVGTQAGLMGMSFAAMVADNDMLGAVMRAGAVPEISEATLALDAIAQVTQGEGHFLGHPDTYARMRSDFLYPEVADRQSVQEWARSDRSSMDRRAAARADDLRRSHWPDHLDEAVSEYLTTTYDLPRRSGANL